MIESEIERKFGRYVRSRGGLYLKQNPTWYVNIPDRLVCVPGGTAFFLELKRPGCSPNNGQLKWARLARQRGHTVYWSDDVDEAIELYEKAFVRVPE